MRTLLTAIMLMVGYIVFAQDKPSMWNQKLGLIATAESQPGWIFIKDNVNISPASLFNQHKEALGLKEKDTYLNTKVQDDPLGGKVLRYQQLHNGVKVENSTLAVHERKGRVRLIIGTVVQGISVSTVPSLTPEQAIKAAISFYGTDKPYAWKSKKKEALAKNMGGDEASFYPVPELVISFSHRKERLNPENYRLMYKVPLLTEKWEGKNIYVDAITGEVVKNTHLVHNCLSASGETLYDGDQDFYAETDPYNGGQYLHDECSRELVTYWEPAGPIAAVDVYDFDGYFENHPEAVSAHWGLMLVWEYFASLGHAGHTGSNDLMRQVVDEEFYENAFYFTFYGMHDFVAYGYPNPTDPKANGALVSIDVVGHEWAHGLTYHSAQLVYEGESGALNESFSDIFGALVEFYQSPGSGNWTIGEDFWDPDGYMRSMSEPKMKSETYSGIPNCPDPLLMAQPNTFEGEYWMDPWDNCDYGGVHINSGVQNYWFYLLSEGGSGENDHEYEYELEGIGYEKAALIVYRALTLYLVDYSGFIDSRKATIYAAYEIFGQCSFEAEQTRLAWDAVGVEEQYVSPYEWACGTKNSSTTITEIKSTGTITACPVSPYYLTVEASAPPIELKAGERIVLKPGVWIKEGSNFWAHIVEICEFFPSYSYKNGNEHDLSEEKQMEPDHLEASYSIFPNPFTNSVAFEISLEAEARVTITVRDVYGKEVVKVLNGELLQVGTYQYQMPGNNLASGIYFAEITIGKTRTVERIVKVTQ